MTIDLYYTVESAQCQAIRMVAAALGVELNLKLVNMVAKEHLRPDFLKINPQHTIPTLHDNGYALWETRAILTYLVEKYGPANSSLYPVDPQRRGKVNQRLYFDMGRLNRSFGEGYNDVVFDKVPVKPELEARMHVAFALLEIFLSEGNQFVAGPQLTVADFMLFATVSLYEVMRFDFSQYKNVNVWYDLLKATIPGKEINVEGKLAVRAFCDSPPPKPAVSSFS